MHQSIACCVFALGLTLAAGASSGVRAQYATEYPTIGDKFAPGALVEQPSDSGGLESQDAAALRPVYDKGVTAIEGFEGWIPYLYNDQAGFCSIGYGHLIKRSRCNGTEPAAFKDGITLAEGRELLKRDLAVAQRALAGVVEIELTDGQYAALVSFTFNVGGGHFRASTLLRRINARNFNDVPRQLRRWIYAGGQVFKGLQNRREGEIALFFDGIAQDQVAAADALETPITFPIDAVDIEVGESATGGADANDGLEHPVADAASVELLYQLEGVRNRPVTTRLATLLKSAAARAGIDRIVIYSGGQPGTTGRSTGTARHNAGNAADLRLYVGGRVQRFSNDSAPRTITDFVTAAASLGATGIGAATDYMGPTSLHVGYGMPRTVWGRNGLRANAPIWLVRALNAGADAAADAGTIAQYYTVVARTGAPMRAGPGSEYQTVGTIDTDTLVSVLALDGPNRDWARVDLVGDGYVDGHMHISTLSSAASGLAADYVEDVEGEVPSTAE